jgi:hypothetical protein
VDELVIEVVLAVVRSCRDVLCKLYFSEKNAIWGRLYGFNVGSNFLCELIPNERYTS